MAGGARARGLFGLPPGPRTATVPRVLALGVAAALAVGAGGLLWEYARLGWTDASAFARVAAQTRMTVADTTASLDRVAEVVARLPATRRALSEDGAPIASLFDAIAETIDREGAGGDAITVFGTQGIPLAWSGRPSELSPTRLSGGPSIFVVSGPLELRLVAVQPIGPSDAGGVETLRLGTVAVEREIARAQTSRPAFGQAYALPTPIVDVAIDLPSGSAAAAPYEITLESPAGDPLLLGRASPDSLAAARSAWRSSVLAWMAFVLGVALLLTCGPLLDRRDAAGSPTTYRNAVGALVIACLIARLLFTVALPGAPSASLAPASLLLGAAFWLAIVLLAADAVMRWRLLAGRARRPPFDTSDSSRRFLAEQFLAGVALTAIVLRHAVHVGRIIDTSEVDVLQLSPYPWDPARLATLCGLAIIHAAAVWAAALVCLAASARWRVARGNLAVAAVRITAWLLPLLVAIGVGSLLGIGLPGWPVLVTAAVAVALGLELPRRLAQYRHASQVTRLVMLLAAFLIPALAVYPTTLDFADRAERRLIETRYAPQTSSHPADLESWLSQSLAQIDDLDSLSRLVQPASASTQSDSAFQIWRQTDLARFRLTSAVELYAADGRLVSRFAFNVPEYAAAAPRSTLGCTWEIFGEASPFGAPDRRMLHAQRSVCGSVGDDPRPLGAVVAHLMLDYRVLPFVASDAPYERLVREEAVRAADPRGRDAEVVVYGWGYRRPLFASGRDAWPLDEATFGRIAASREPFWTTLAKGGASYDVHLSNDSAGIYAIGVPVRRPFDMVVNVTEIGTLVGVLFAALLLGVVVFRRVARPASGPGRQLFRELRASFYRKLSLAFIAAAIVPVLTLALVIRLYFTAQLRAGVEAEAIRTAAVARRVIEEISLLQPLADDSVAPFSDDVMVWISEVIDQDVNIFNGQRLVATSERDLYASGLLPTRTPDDVYRGIAIQRLPSWVGAGRVGDFQYVLAATPVGGTNRDTILTVPLTSRQQQIERQIDDLDRGIQLGVVSFILLGGVLGLSMAERIADPVRRLTRVTTQIARGDFDVRVAVRSADELQRLVQAFNGMAAELKAQRGQLERTHRLEAWAEMARQVAHEIKNPLTPIQLSAEHLRRVHADRGEPLAPVLESCVDSILTQVRLLRQISAEFWSFALAPTARPALVKLDRLVREVIEPYRVGLGDRIWTEIDVPADLPSLLIDPTLTTRALTNIVENALHAMPGQGTFTATARRDGPTVWLSLVDTGVGMDEEARAHIFEPYFSTRATGTGLGLTIAKRNIELSGGTIELESVAGRGTMVTIRLSLDGSPDA